MAKKIDWKSLREETDRLTEKYTRQTGRAISAWNLLQDTLGTLFAEIANPSHHKMALAIWYSQQSDRSQRGMLKAVSQVAYGADSKLHGEIKWLCGAADTLAEHRNNVTHVAYSVDLDRTLSKVAIAPRGVGVSARADKMSTRDIFEEMRVVEENSKALFQFAILLTPSIAYPEMQEPLPDRPSLLKPKAPPTPKQANPKRQKKSQPRQPPSSQE